MIEQAATILYVENDPNDIILLKVAFQRLGFPIHLVSVPDGEKAQEYLQGRWSYSEGEPPAPPDLVLLDLKMPRQSGFEITHWIRAQLELQGLPVVILTSSEQPEDRTIAFESGANAFFIKPIGLEELEMVAREICTEYLHLPVGLSSGG